ncbi:MAG TPA: DUF4124 domain-containing protein [Alcanivorax sp.]|jgi:hypothetical protein|uniref:DUF4124 domain-containing protein n=1 Tax=Alcanivorax TaxID=59753 RepID=UPI000C6ACB2C|nr:MULTISPECIES: DUF4124 domain-containing protein [Alcanivorax]MAC15197.1 DUF4124 domain-containing protein [Alcanivorax sp.]MBG33792.1 DUF4124 domain-containing protein [Alcanivorax sp.]MDF1638349.1 DUF4124 domain-containing protein [Alcanivorax jadensis]HBC19993.1 DUF4124 domain-containing protein [Alcanivorax sp.]|tara:strand:- start:1120 stop:1581 length:462 start_codon:yes stop_codon:yes gene_type:complete
MNKFSLLLGSLLLILASASSAAKFYKWVDDQGVTHYGANPPQGTTSSEVNTRANASSDQDRELEALDERRNARENAKEEAAKAAEEETRLKSEPDELAQERCEQHRKNLETLKNKPIVRRKNPETGEMEVLDQEEREKMIQNSQKALENCTRN